MKRLASKTVVSAWLIAAAAMSGCGGSSGGTTTDDAGTTGALDVLNDDAYDATGCTLTSCPSGKVLHACTCVDVPRTATEFATRRVGCSELTPPGGGGMRNKTDDFCDPNSATAAPSLGCFLPGMRHVRGTPRNVTLYGWVDVFGNGGDSGSIVVEVYEEGANGELGRMVGTSTSELAASATEPCAREEQEYMDGRQVGERRLGFYSIANVPTETPLIIKTTGPSELWKPLYTYNFQVLNDEVAAGMPAAGSCEATKSITGDRFSYVARTLSTSDYRTIPLTAALPGGIQPGNGALAGEVHDCDDVRLTFGQVGVHPTPVSFVYFNNEPDNPIPVTGRTEGTSLLGLYAALDLAPGPVDVSAVARVGADMQTLGWYRARIFPNSVTVVTLRGLR